MKNGLKREMARNTEQKKIDIDLWIIAITTCIVFGIYIVLSTNLMKFIKDGSIPVIIRLVVNVMIQYGIAGLGITVVLKLRRETFRSYGLHKDKLLISILLSIVCFLPYLLFVIVSGQFEGYSPLSIFLTDEILNSNLLIRILGMALIAIAWGFFEGMNYVVICDKINQRYPSKYRWFDCGAFICTLVCILFHPFQISVVGISEIICTFIMIYGMLIVRKHTKNAWGCIFIFVFLWNAF